MPYYMGVDLGGTKLAYVMADGDLNFIHQKIYPSPFRTTAGTLADGSPEVFIDTILTEVPVRKRVAEYLSRTEAEFLSETDNRKVEAKGYSLCGKTWLHNGEIRMIGGNTPARLGNDPGDGNIGIKVGNAGDNIVAANDGNAAAHAQGIYYQVVHGIDPRETGYLILGTGFGFGVPGYFAMTEIGHMPVALMPEPLWQACGCTEGHRTACAENFVSGRGIRNTAECLLALDQNILGRIAVQMRQVPVDVDLVDAVKRTRMEKGRIDPELIMRMAQYRSDALAVFVAELAAFVTAHAAISAACLFGLRRIGVGETIAQFNPWHVDRIAAIASDYLRGNTLLRPPLRIELTPIADPAKYGPLSLVAPESRYEVWVEKMKS